MPENDLVTQSLPLLQEPLNGSSLPFLAKYAIYQPAMSTTDLQIENIILALSSRGMDALRKGLSAGYCKRAAHLILENNGVVLIGTGFPVGSSFETDGPIGAISLYKVLESLKNRPIFVCAPPISRILSRDFNTYEIPIRTWEETKSLVETALVSLKPSLVISVERPGVAEDGRYYNMRKEDITEYAAKYDLFLELCTCPTIAFGDGGNEIGMGNFSRELSHMSIIPSITKCDELVIATVSNWGVYGVIAAMSLELGTDLFKLFDPAEIANYLLENGSVDGVTLRAENSEDGFPLSVGLSIILRLRELLPENMRNP
ncbi:MAG: DUF4392 domain-containing protein [Desulfobacteraceae bacterium]|jgi:hypothetical protein